jgi:hypothetical protein
MKILQNSRWISSLKSGRHPHCLHQCFLNVVDENTLRTFFSQSLRHIAIMTTQRLSLLLSLACFLLPGSSIECFVVSPRTTAFLTTGHASIATPAPLKVSLLLAPGDFDALGIISASTEPVGSSFSSSSSVNVAAATVDPTTFLSDIFAGVLGTPIILAIPIVAALLVAGLVVGFIVNYANPTEPDE